MESLRFVVCARAACGQVFFLCRWCDRGQWYCGRSCAGVMRQGTLRAAGARYQDSARGRRRHAARQHRYRSRRREKVTHHSPQARGACGRKGTTRDVPDDSRNADLLFQVVSRRHEKRSLVLTTNLAFRDWQTIFPNATSAVALIDRLIHHADVIAIEGDSYRLREAEQALKKKATPKPRPPKA